MFKRTLLALALATLTAPVFAGECTLLLKDMTCTFATDTSGGVARFTNPSNLTNIGSGVISPFLTEQKNGSEGGVSTDSTSVNTLPLDDKRDNSNKFTTTFQLNQLGFVTVAGVDYFTFFLDINESNGGNDPLLSLDTLRIWGRSGTSGETAPFMLDNTNVTSIADLDLLPNLQLVYAMGPGNDLLLNYDLFSGSGLGYDLSVLIPTSAFAGLASDSRILFTSAFGGSATPGADTSDGFEEWAYLKGAGPRAVDKVPEPAPIALLGLGLLGVAVARRRRPGAFPGL